MAQLAERSLPITRGLRFESRHRQFFIEHLFTVNCIEKAKKKRKRGRERPMFFLKKYKGREKISSRLRIEPRLIVPNEFDHSATYLSH